MSEKVSKASLSDIKFDRANANKGSERGRGMIEASMREFGFADAGTLDRNNTIIGGNKRTEVAGEIELSDEAIIIDVDGTKPVFIRRNDLDLNDPNDDKARKLAYALNRSSEVSLNWDAEQLLADLNAGVDLSALFRDDELDALLAELTPKLEVNDGGGQVDRAEELRQKWSVEAGQLWQLGEHMLICGDCTDAEVVARVMDGEKADCAITSPPYAMQRANQYGGVPTDEYVEWWGKVQACVRSILVDDGSFFVNIKPHTEDGERVLYVFDMVLSMKRQWGWLFVDEFAWVHEGIPGQWSNRLKNRFEPIYQFAKGATLVRHESIKHASKRSGKYAAKDGTTSQGNVGFDGNISEGLALPGNVLEINHGVGRDDNAVHPAKFPVDLPGFFIKAFSDMGDLWYEPFGGSGTTGIACHQLGRRSRMVEISPQYCAVILERFKDIGVTPKLIEHAASDNVSSLVAVGAEGNEVR